jgi:hypothetical protein
MKLVLLASLLFINNHTDWEMTCKQYNEAVDVLYADPFFARPENHRDRLRIHEKFKLHTSKTCLNLLT